MTEPPSAPLPPKFVRCPGCDQRLGVRAEDVGRKARCAKCGLVFVIEGGAKPQAAASRPAVEDEGPTTVTFECSLCQTRITMSTANVGKKVACPDCGRKNVIPPPPKAKVVQAPAAMSGEQFGVWGVDVKTWEAGAVAAAPVLHPVVCDLCQTRMYATEAQLGSALACPDCGTTTVAKRSKPQKPSGPMPAPAGEEYQLDPTSAPTQRPTPIPIAISYAEAHVRARALTTEKRRTVREQLPRDERPGMPAMPVVQGAWRMLVSGEALQRWLLLSVWLSAIAWCSSQVALAMSGGMGAIAGICFLAMALIMGMLWLSSAAPLWLAMITESSEGHDRLQDPPRWSSYEWFSELLMVAMAATASAIPAWGISKLADMAWRASGGGASGGMPEQWQDFAAAVAWFACFPVALLSALHERSPLNVISARVMISLGRCFVPWLAFYVVSALWLAGIGFIAYHAAGQPLATVSLSFLAVAASLGYMRLLGRLAWWLSEWMPEEVEEESEDDAAAAHPHLAAARRAERERVAAQGK